MCVGFRAHQKYIHTSAELPHSLPSHAELSTASSNFSQAASENACQIHKFIVIDCKFYRNLSKALAFQDTFWHSSVSFYWNKAGGKGETGWWHQNTQHAQHVNSSQGTVNQNQTSATQILQCTLGMSIKTPNTSIKLSSSRA